MDARRLSERAQGLAHDAMVHLFLSHTVVKKESVPTLGYEVC